MFRWTALARSLTLLSLTPLTFYSVKCKAANFEDKSKRLIQLDELEAKKIISSSTMPSELSEVVKIIGKATTLRRKGDYAAALEEVQSLLDIHQSSEGMLAWIYMEKGHSLLAQGKMEMAYEAYNESLKRSKFDTFNQIYPSAIYEQSKILSEKGDSEQAIAKIQEAMRFVRENQKEKVEERLAQMQNRLGGFYYKQGNFDLAKLTLEDTLAKQEEIYKTHQNIEIAVTLQRLAQVALVLNDSCNAEKSAQESLEINLKLLGSNHPEIGKGLFIIGQIKDKQNQIEQARNYYTKALEIYIQKRPDHPHIAEIRKLLKELPNQ